MKELGTIIDKLTLTLVFYLYAQSGASSLPATIWYILAGVNLVLFCLMGFIKIGERQWLK